ncbi:glycogen synthase GlgA [Robbsia sp. KACC 23696]|uniref:glycogen synthase GlgA n=1 Tax=Robbsia sp. KACC 23696 TaxID=3149231 RepID=UPI00325C1338
MSLHVLLVASEALPLAKTGGLGDMLSAYASALQEGGVATTIMLPGYPEALEKAHGLQAVATLDGLPGGDAVLMSGSMPDSGIPVLLVKCDALYARDGLYQDENGADWGDNAIRFGTLSAAAVRVAQGIPGLPKVDVVHAHDWHTGLTPMLMKLAGLRTPSVFTIHNLAFQGNYPMDLAPKLGIPVELLDCNQDAPGIEFYGQLSFMKAAIRYADRVTTVSETYAREITTPRFGHLMEGLLQAESHKLIGIMNGIDVDAWDPAHDPMIPRHFSLDEMRGKHACKRELQQAFGLPTDPFVPVVAMGSRLTGQKMADLALETIPALMDAYPRLQVIVLGKGDGRIELGMARLAQRFPDRVAVHIGFDERRAHLLHAGADILLHGSRFEPCGLTPMYSMRYGTLPIASRVGGLADSIVDASDDPSRGTGFLFDGETVEAMTEAACRAVDAYMRPQAWRELQRHAMLADFRWQAPAARYTALYAALSGKRPVRANVAKVRAAVRRRQAANDRAPARMDGTLGEMRESLVQSTSDANGAIGATARTSGSASASSSASAKRTRAGSKDGATDIALTTGAAEPLEQLLA